VKLQHVVFPAQQRTKLHSTTPTERLNKAMKRRAAVVDIFRNEASIIRRICAVLFEQNDHWQSRHRYWRLEDFVLMDVAEIDPLLSMPTRAARSMSSMADPEALAHLRPRPGRM
jgi:hypothetical protein